MGFVHFLCVAMRLQAFGPALATTWTGDNPRSTNLLCVSFQVLLRGGATHRTALGATTNRSLALSLTPALWSWLWTCGSSWWALSPGFSLPRFHLTCPPARGPKRAGALCWNVSTLLYAGLACKARRYIDGRIGTAVGVHIVNHHANPHLLID